MGFVSGTRNFQTPKHGQPLLRVQISQHFLDRKSQELLLASLVLILLLHVEILVEIQDPHQHIEVGRDLVQRLLKRVMIDGLLDGWGFQDQRHDIFDSLAKDLGQEHKFLGNFGMVFETICHELDGNYVGVVWEG